MVTSVNRLNDIKLNGAMTSALEFDYDPLSRRTKLTYENGVATDYDLELDGDLTSLIHRSNLRTALVELSSQAVDDTPYRGKTPIQNVIRR